MELFIFLVVGTFLGLGWLITLGNRKTYDDYERMTAGAAPRLSTDEVTVAGVRIAHYEENREMVDENQVSATLVAEARVAGLRIEVDKRLKRLEAAASLGVVTYGEVVRAELTGISWAMTEQRDLDNRVAIVALCRGPDYEEAVKALLRLGASEDRGPLPAELLVQYLDDDRAKRLAGRLLERSCPERLRLAAAERLGDTETLAGLLTDGALDDGLSGRALTALLRSSRQRAREVVRGGQVSLNQEGAMTALGLLAPPDLAPGDEPALLRFCHRSWELRVRQLALQRLGQLDTAAARDGLLEALASEDLEHAELALKVLADAGDPRARRLLLERLLKDADNDEQVFAAQGLARVGTLEDVEFLVRVRDRRLEAPRVRRAAEEAINILQAGASGERGGISLAGASESGALSLAAPGAEGDLSLSEPET
jgi:hypothetical protein